MSDEGYNEGFFAYEPGVYRTIVAPFAADAAPAHNETTVIVSKGASSIRAFFVFKNVGNAVVPGGIADFHIYYRDTSLQTIGIGFVESKDSPYIGVQNGGEVTTILPPGTPDPMERDIYIALRNIAAPIGATYLEIRYGRVPPRYDLGS